MLTFYLCCFAEASSARSGEGPVSGRDEAEGGARSRAGAQTNYPDHAGEVGRERRCEAF